MLSFVLAGYAAYSTRWQAHVSAQPRLTYAYFYGSDGAGWRIHNSGLGMSRLRGFRILFDDEPVNDLLEFARLLGVPDGTAVKFTNPLVGERWAVGHENDLFWISDSAAVAAVRQNWERVSIQACYCSIFDECWIQASDGRFTEINGEHRRDDECSPFAREPRSRWWGG